MKWRVVRRMASAVAVTLALLLGVVVVGCGTPTPPPTPKTPTPTPTTVLPEKTPPPTPTPTPRPTVSDPVTVSVYIFIDESGGMNGRCDSNTPVVDVEERRYLLAYNIVMLANLWQEVNLANVSIFLYRFNDEAHLAKESVQPNDALIWLRDRYKKKQIPGNPCKTDYSDVINKIKGITGNRKRIPETQNTFAFIITDGSFEGWDEIENNRESKLTELLDIEDIQLFVLLLSKERQEKDRPTPTPTSENEELEWKKLKEYHEKWEKILGNRIVKIETPEQIQEVIRNISKKMNQTILGDNPKFLVGTTTVDDKLNLEVDPKVVGLRMWMTILPVDELEFISIKDSRLITDNVPAITSSSQKANIWEARFPVWRQVNANDECQQVTSYSFDPQGGASASDVIFYVAKKTFFSEIEFEIQGDNTAQFKEIDSENDKSQIEIALMVKEKWKWVFQNGCERVDVEPVETRYISYYKNECKNENPKESLEININRDKICMKIEKKDWEGYEPGKRRITFTIKINEVITNSVVGSLNIIYTPFLTGVAILTKTESEMQYLVLDKLVLTSALSANRIKEVIVKNPKEVKGGCGGIKQNKLRKQHGQEINVSKWINQDKKGENYNDKISCWKERKIEVMIFDNYTYTLEITECHETQNGARCTLREEKRANN